jgi:hypothetical protein
MAGTTVKTDELVEEIVRRVMAGESISHICQRKGMPDRRTVHRWLAKDTEFKKAYNEAALVRAHELLTESLEIADREKSTAKDVAADRLRINTRMKLAAVYNPKAFRKIVPRKLTPPKGEEPQLITVEIVRSQRDAINARKVAEMERLGIQLPGDWE